MLGRAVGWARVVRDGAVDWLFAAPARRMQARLLSAHAVYGPPGRLDVVRTAVVNDAVFNVSSGRITVGEWAMFGHGVMILTGTHDITKFGPERQGSSPPSGRDVHIDEGAWLASRVTVVGPCRIGAHSVVAAGSLVRDDVAPYTVVAGSPARLIRELPGAVEGAQPS